MKVTKLLTNGKSLNLIASAEGISGHSGPPYSVYITILRPKPAWGSAYLGTKLGAVLSLYGGYAALFLEIQSQLCVHSDTK